MKYTLKNLGVKGHDICKLPLNISRKNQGDRDGETETETDTEHK